MNRSNLFAAIFSLLVFAPCVLPAASASDTTVFSNIGFVLYTKSDAPGTLNARWIYGKQYRGPGIATGGPRDGYAGEYHVRYFLESGEFSDEYKLIIVESGDIYTASWLVDGRLRAEGVGMEVDNGLGIGWHRVEE